MAENQDGAAPRGAVDAVAAVLREFVGCESCFPLSDKAAHGLAAAVIKALGNAGLVVVDLNDLRSLLREGVDWNDDHGPTVRLADAANAATNAGVSVVRGDGSGCHVQP